jgi:hypothetical protein
MPSLPAKPMTILDQIPRRLMLLASMLVLSMSALLVAAVQARADGPTTSPHAAFTPSPAPVDQTSAGSPAPSTNPAPPAPSDQATPQDQTPTPTQSNTTTQTIGQVQNLGCTAGCSGTTQTQSAGQQNNTVEVLPPSSDPPVSATPPSATPSPSSTTSSSSSTTPSPSSPATPSPSSPATPSPSSTTTVTQIQLGCVSHCSGTTTISSDPQLAEQTIGQLLKSSAVPTLPSQNPVAANQQNVVDQSAFQSQQGDGATTVQGQDAQQTNSTAQSGTPTDPPAGSPADPPPSFSGLDSAVLNVLSTVENLLATIGTPSDEGSAAGDAPPSHPASAPADPTSSPADPGGSDNGPAGSSSEPLAPVVNQTEQAIWQIQIGCLMFCTDTDQSQQAAQSDSTFLVTPTPATPTGGGSATVSTYQLIWQLQIGCIFWCYDAVETQTASASTSVITELPPGPPASPPSGTGSDTASSPSPVQVVVPISGRSLSGSLISPPPPGEIVGDPIPASQVTTPPALVPLPIERSAPSSTGTSEGNVAEAMSRGTQTTPAVALLSPPLRPVGETTSRRIAQRIEHRYLSRAPRSSGAVQGSIALRAARDQTGLVLLGLAAFVVVLLAGDLAWRRRKLSRARRAGG